MNDEAISTGCASVDDLLGGGFERGTVTQVYGPPASGKTNLALSAAVETAVDEGTTVYIDTEGVSVDRFEQLLSGRAGGGRAASRTAAGVDGGPAGVEDVPAGVEDATVGIENDPAGADRPRARESEDAERDVGDVETLASRIVIEDALDFDEQAEAVRDVESFAERADLVVLDSATGFYRLERGEDDDGGDALRAVARQVTHLLSLARKHDIAVVLTNQVFADPDSDRTRALGGNTLEHWTGVVVRLERFRGGNRRATLEKHRSKPAGESAQFRITETGVESGGGTAGP